MTVKPSHTGLAYALLVVAAALVLGLSICGMWHHAVTDARAWLTRNWLHLGVASIAFHLGMAAEWWRNRP